LDEMIDDPKAFSELVSDQEWRILCGNKGTVPSTRTVTPTISTPSKPTSNSKKKKLKKITEDGDYDDEDEEEKDEYYDEEEDDFAE